MTRPDVLFIHPNASEEVYQELSKDYSAVEPPIWAAMLANHVRVHGFNPELMDCEALHIHDDMAMYHIRNMNPRLIAFVIYGQQPSASSQNMEGAIRLAEKIKKESQYPILFVGGHIAALPREVLERHSCVDFVCQNEGVYTISNLLKVTNFEDDSQLEKVLGLGFKTSIYRSDTLEKIILNPPSPIVSKEDLETQLPGMALDLLPMKYYRTALWHSLSNNCDRTPFAALYTSLGCPKKCHFCMINIINRTTGTYSNESNIFRWWKPEFIIKQLDEIAKLGITNVKIADELFVLNPNHFEKTCELIIERGYKFNIWCYSRVDTIKEKYLETMKKAGINWVALGIEAANKNIRKDVIKGDYEDVDIRSVVKQVRDSGINLIANYIFGLSDDNLETMNETLDLAIELNTEEANFYSAMAYPGSPLYGEAKRNGIILPEKYSGYSQHSYDCTPMSTKYLSAKEVLAFRDSSWKIYHENPNYLDMIERKFGDKAKKNIIESTKIILKRKLSNND